jgi:N-acetylglucosamine kinase-like BadF-type ATPase
MYFVGVDAGGTKTSFVLADENGRVRARHHSGGGSFLALGAEGLRALIADGVHALCRTAAIDRAQITGAALGFPGYGEEEGSEQQIAAACEAAIGAGKVVCQNDSYLGWAGSLAMQPGINIVAGTGAICFGVNEAGASARTSGWGSYCDEGSCRWIGERLIQVFTKQSDGRLPRTKLYDMFKQHAGIEHDLHFIAPLNHELGFDPSKTAQLQRVLKDIYDAGDHHAEAIYREAAQELWLAIHTTARKLDMSQTPFLVSYSGGLFRSGECVLGPLRDHVHEGGGTLVAPRFEPDLGAVLIAMHQAMPGKDFAAFAFVE